MKKILLSCFLALGIGINAQYNYTSTDPFNDLSSFYFTATPSNVSAMCGTINGVQQSSSATNTQLGYAIDLNGDNGIGNALGQTNNGQAATISLDFKKTGTGAGTLYLVYFEADYGATTWDVKTIQSVSITTSTVTTCTNISGVIPAGKMLRDGTKEYGYGYFFVRSSGNASIQTTNYKIVQDVVASVPNCTSFISPANGSTSGYGSILFNWNAAPTAVGYHLTVGTTSGASDVFNGDVFGAEQQYVSTNPNTTYYAKVVPFNDNGDAVGCTEISFNTNNSLQYCSATSPTYTNATYEIISRVRIADIDNSSPTSVGTPGYEDFTSVVGHVVQGKSYPITVNITGFDSTGPDKTTVWIDFNKNGLFEDSEKTVLSNAAAATGTVVVPSDAVVGDTRMRVSMTYSADPVSCGTNAYGQVEDYTINIAELVAPSCVTITAPTDGATNVTAPTTTLTWTADAMASGYKVYVGTSYVSTDIVNGTLVTGTTYDVSGLSRNTLYFASVIPTNTKGDATGCTVISFTTGANWTYCAATHTTTNADRITGVTFEDITNTSTTSGTGGYSDYTTIVGHARPGDTYPIALTITSGNANDKAKVWIDYNQDGVFDDATEMTELTRQSNTLINGNITIPASATLGNTRMRIRMSRQTSSSSIVACGNISAQGETEDYTLNINNTLGTIGASKVALSIYPNPFTDILRISDIKGVKSVSINDFSGRQVRSMKPSAELNLSALNSGIYLITLHMEDGSTQSFKAIKK